MDIDFRADIYSLGATLYHLVTGRPPFEGDTPTAVMHKHLKQPLTPPDHLNTSLSSGIGEVIELAMAKDREDRYASTEDLLEDLRAVRAGNPPIHARHGFDADAMARIEETGVTVDLGPAPRSPFAQLVGSSLGLGLLLAAGASVLVNVLLLVVMMKR